MKPPVSVTIDRLFDVKRFSSGLNYILLTIYFPLGVVLALLRFFIGFHAYIIACVLPKTSLIRRFVLRIMCGILGIIVVQNDLNEKSSKCHVLVSNYTTPLDHIAIELVQPNVLPSVWDLPDILMWLLGYHDMGAKYGRESLIQNASRHCKDSPVPLLAFPENATTNGRVGLLKFSVWPFSLDQPVQPIAVQVQRPLINAAPSVLNSKWWTDFLWFLFVPVSIFHIRYLPEATQDEEETPHEFAKRVQVAIAKAVQVEPTSFTSADKLEHVKRHIFSQNHSTGSNTNGADRPSTAPTASSGQASEMDVMVSQVKVVLPHVPVDAIRKDLALTKDIDLTITNILEGKVTFSPEEAAVEADRATSPDRLATPVVNRNTHTPSKSNSAAPVTFPKNPQDRHRSFEERKKELLQQARQRYITKHGLTVEK